MAFSSKSVFLSYEWCYRFPVNDFDYYSLTSVVERPSRDLLLLMSILPPLTPFLSLPKRYEQKKVLGFMSMSTEKKWSSFSDWSPPIISRKPRSPEKLFRNHKSYLWFHITTLRKVSTRAALIFILLTIRSFQAPPPKNSILLNPAVSRVTFPEIRSNF